MGSNKIMWFSRYNQLSLNERILIFCAILLALHGLWNMAFYEPLLEKRAQLTQQLQMEQDKLQAVSTTLSKQMRQEDSPLMQNIQQLENTKYSLDEQMRQAYAQLVSPEEMSAILHQIMTQDSRLQLTQLNTSPAKALNPSDKGTQDPLNGLYKHDLSLEFQGGYMAVLGYLKNLEKIQQRVFWDSIQYKVDSYPVATIKLQLHTLSLPGAYNDV